MHPCLHSCASTSKQLCARAQERQRELEEAQRKLQEREDVHKVLLQEHQDKHEEHMKQAQREHEERMSHDKQRIKEQLTHMKQQEAHMKQQETQRTASLDALQVHTIFYTLNPTPYILQGRLDGLEESEEFRSEFEPACRLRSLSMPGACSRCLRQAGAWSCAWAWRRWHAYATVDQRPCFAQ